MRESTCNWSKRETWKLRRNLGRRIHVWAYCREELEGRNSVTGANK